MAVDLCLGQKENTEKNRKQMKTIRNDTETTKKQQRNDMKRVSEKAETDSREKASECQASKANSVSVTNS